MAKIPRNINNIKVEWTSPSNIALIKYWGKHGNQLPSNASLSLTLKNAITRTSLSVSDSNHIPSLQFNFDGNPAPDFLPKIEAVFNKISKKFPFIEKRSLKIESWNSFPHSAGIASSASSMSALALCICDISWDMNHRKSSSPMFFRQASEVSRLGSGSATRSVYGNFSVWGRVSQIEESSDEYAVPLNFPVHKVFSKLQDSILIVSSERKKISSTAGHELMNFHPYAKERYKLAERNLELLIRSLKTGNIIDFVRITENEALGLHSLMMSSDPGFTLIEPGTLAIIGKIRNFRERTGKFLCFTLDAGPNVHLIYPESEKKDVIDFINNELLIYCENKRVIWDECGDGPVKLQ